MSRKREEEAEREERTGQGKRSQKEELRARKRARVRVRRVKAGKEKVKAGQRGIGRGRRGEGALRRARGKGFKTKEKGEIEDLVTGKEIYLILGSFRVILIDFNIILVRDLDYFERVQEMGAGDFRQSKIPFPFCNHYFQGFIRLTRCLRRSPSIFSQQLSAPLEKTRAQSARFFQVSSLSYAGIFQKQKYVYQKPLQI